VFREMLRLIKI